MKVEKKIESLQYQLFLLPGLFAYTLFIIYPLLKSAFYSLTSFNGTSMDYTFVGLSNYLGIFKDEALLNSLLFTFLYTVSTVLMVTVLSILLAVIFDMRGFGKGFQRAAFFFPYVPSKLLIGFLWSMILTPTGSGVLNAILKSLFGIDPIPWLSDPMLARGSIIVVAVWCSLGYHAMIYLAYLQSIPNDYYEAACIDGASWWQQFSRITLPMLSPAITISVMLLITDGLKIFDLPRALTNGGPGFSTYTFTQVIMLRGITERNYGTASAMSVVFCLLVLAISGTHLAISQRKEREI